MSFWNWIRGKYPDRVAASQSAAESASDLHNTLDGIESETTIRLDLLRERVRGVREQVTSQKLPAVAARRGDR